LFKCGRRTTKPCIASMGGELDEVWREWGKGGGRKNQRGKQTNVGACVREVEDYSK